MKVLDKIALAIFSVVMLVISAIYIGVYFNYFDSAFVMFVGDFIINQEPNKTVFLGIAIVSLLLSLKVVLGSFFCSDTVKDPIKIEGENGTVEIMPETIENIAKITISNYVAVSDIVAKMQSKKEGIVVNVCVTVLPEINITELVTELQGKVKERIERQTSATVLKVNVKVKDIKKAKEE